MRQLRLFVIIFLLGVLSFPNASFGVMSSTNYTIFADSIDSGGVLSTGGAYSLEDSVGESPAGSSTSSVYEVISGYQSMDWSVLAIEATATTIDLGTLNVSQVASAATTISVTADAETGYVLSVGAVGGTSLAAVADGAVTAGQEEYGIAVSSTDAAFADDQGIIAGLNLSASSTPVVSAQSILTFKAAMAPGSTSGSRSQSVTLTASTNI